MLCLAACLAVGVAAVARAAEGDPDLSAAPDPYSTCETGALAGTCPDTDQTPKMSKETSLFDQVAGAEFPKNDQADPKKLVFGSPTSFEDNLYTVAFSEQAGVGGFAGGAICDNPEPNHESGCKPVLYQYKTFDATHGPEWRQIDLQGNDKPGYIGAIAWIGRTGTALAVGGDGVYPRRDPAYKDECQEWDVLDDAPNPTDPQHNIRTGQRKRLIGAYGSKCDPAGKARAWLYNKDGDGRWEELTDQLPRADGTQDVQANGAGATAPKYWLPDTDNQNLTSDMTSTSGLTQEGIGVDNSQQARCLDPTVSGKPSDNPKNRPNWKACAKKEGPGSGNVQAPAPLSEPAKPGVPRAGMHGFTALGCDSSQSRELCFAGGLGQIWRWEAGRFLGAGVPGGRVDAQSAASELQSADRFRFRVRAIRFFAGVTSPIAVAVTAGCCTGDQARNYARVLAYGAGGGSPRWVASSLSFDYARDGSSSSGSSPGSTGGSIDDDALHAGDSVRLNQERPDSLFSVTVDANTKGLQVSAIASPGGEPGVYKPAGEPPSQVTSRYCLLITGEFSSPHPSEGQKGWYTPVYDASSPTRINLSTARLIAGDGDLSRDYFSEVDTNASNPVHPLFEPNRGSPSSHSSDPGDPLGCHRQGPSQTREHDAVPDWVVGELRSTGRAGLGARGLLYANPLRPGFTYETLDPPLHAADSGIGQAPVGPYSTPSSADIASQSYKPTDDKRLAAWAAAPYFLLPSYGLNAIDIVGESASGWAVGDHGAILKLSGDAVTKQAPEPKAPNLGARRPAGLPDGSPYDSKTPEPSQSAGQVPSLASQPTEKLAAPRLIAAGAPDPSSGSPTLTPNTSAHSVAIGRDGGEGWAVGPSDDYAYRDSPTTLYHYDGRQWSLCDPVGVKGQLPADPTCASVAAIFSFPDTKDVLRSVRLRAIARVPLENDADPANDDQFEAIAVGTSYIDRPGHDQTPVIVRYRDGRWDFEDGDARAAISAQSIGANNVLEGDGGGSGLIGIAFTAPDDGWILSFTAGVGVRLFHFDGRHWLECSATAPSDTCSDPERRLTAYFSTTTSHGRVTAAGHGAALGLLTAGDRVYLYGTRLVPIGSSQFQTCVAIVYHERGASTWRGSAEGSGGSFDPSFASGPPPAGQACDGPGEMALSSLAVGQGADGHYEGWAVGELSKRERSTGRSTAPEQRLLRLSADGRWRPFKSDDALGDYFDLYKPTRSRTSLMLPKAGGGLDAFIVELGRVLKFNPDRERWEIVDSGGADALAPDNRGGFWALRGIGNPAHQHFLHYTDRAPEPVFDEVPNPAGSQGLITATSPGAAGQLWLATNSDALYRYDRRTGWDKVRISGWDPGRVVTRPSAARAIALNRTGVGVVVGEQGRIADIDGTAVNLDAAAGTRCDRDEITPPCGTGWDLRAAALAPEGSAMVGGRGLSLLWRPGAGGDFRAIQKPDAAAQTTITGISMPSADRAWLTMDTGFLFAGRLNDAGEWSWTLENVTEQGDALTLDTLGQQSALQAIAVDASGHGFAVGDRGVILERSSLGGDRPWTRLRTPFLDNLTSVALATGDGTGALIGARRGAILTYVGERFELARAPETFKRGVDGFEVGGVVYDHPVVGLALLPGERDGEAEAWAAIQGTPAGESELLHYASDPSEPLLNPQDRAKALADASPPRPGELSFAAFGGTRCMNRPGGCLEMALSSEDYETYTQRTIAEIAARSRRPGGPAFSLFSGDTTDTVGAPSTGRTARGSAVDSLNTALRTAQVAATDDLASGRSPGELRLRRFSELVADRLEEAGVPFFAAIGGGDISAPQTCFSPGVCAGTGSIPGAPSAGENLAWRQAMASQRAPWGAGQWQSPDANGLGFEAATSAGAVDPDKTRLPGGLGTAGDASLASDPTGTGQLQGTRVKAGGAHTHYAFDLSRGDRKVARLVFVDTSLRSLLAADQIQNPAEPKGGQAAWLDQMLCPQGKTSTGGDPCTREPQELAIVVSNAPSYSYGPGQSQTHIGDASAFEQTIAKNQANVVVSGRIGWNGLYYTQPDANNTSVNHTPAPGGAYPPGPPDPLAGQPDPIPYVVASGGGQFAKDASDTSAAAGFWHGYTIVRLDPSGDYRKTIVEQRPVLDWLSISAERHVLRPGGKLSLKGTGREPVATSPGGGKNFEVRDDEISGPAITHRYDLVLADPEKPWVPLVDEGSTFEHHYVPLPGQHAEAGTPECVVGCIDEQSGQVSAGGGQQERTYALAILSVADKTATFPLVFEPRPSFRAPPAPALVPLPPASAPPPAPAPPAPAPPFNPPTLASPPPLPPLPPQVPLAPPAPPAPPGGGPAQLDLFTSPPVLSVAPSVSLFPPSAPVINVAPPTPARPVEKAKKVAVQKSGSGIGDDKKSEIQGLGGDLANSPLSGDGASGMTRHDPSAFTAIAHRDQASAWARDLQWGGGITLMALVLALGYTTVRPGPRRRQPEVPAPARAWTRRR